MDENQILSGPGHGIIADLPAIEDGVGLRIDVKAPGVGAADITDSHSGHRKLFGMESRHDGDELLTPAGISGGGRPGGWTTGPGSWGILFCHVLAWLGG